MGDFKSTGAPSRIAKWAERAQVAEGDEFQLITWPPVGEGFTIQVWAVNDIKDHHAWSLDVEGAAQDHANENGQPCRFQLAHARSGVQRARLELRRTPAFTTGEVDPSASGQIAQAMAHNEVFLQVAFGGMKYTVDAMQRENERLRLDNERLRQRIETLEAREHKLADRNYDLTIREAEAVVAATANTEPASTPLEDAVAIALADAVPHLMPFFATKIQQAFMPQA